MSGRGASMSGTVIISSGSEGDLQSAVANNGPISVAVDAQSNAFRVSIYSRMSVQNGLFSLPCLWLAKAVKYCSY